jgi:hypothetical protein
MHVAPLRRFCGSLAEFLGFEVLSAVTVKSIMLWDVTPRSPVKINRRFGRTCGFHLQGPKNKSNKLSERFSKNYRLSPVSVKIYHKMTGSCEHGNEPSGSTKGETFVN